ncbi:uncharacterized protein RNJ42_00653 [Nakaseomyces bracarensis]|uniref:uncharacterized protein n=1 Tax=Nakaseomyces bracarensis TaxID=273131 RepID=UPI003871314F
MAPNKHSKNGTTHKIREQLNFIDEKKWKRFSSRRLELIDKFQLSQFKASEQDLNIKQIANILRTEFGYPVTYSSEFEKLVTAAIQSVRRNRKRSKKKSFMVNGTATGTGPGGKSSNYSTSDEDSISRMASPVGVLVQPSSSSMSMSMSVSPTSTMSQPHGQIAVPPHLQAQGQGQVQAQGQPQAHPMMIQSSNTGVIQVPVPVSLQQHSQQPPQHQQQLQDPIMYQPSLSLPQPHEMRFARATTPLHENKFQRMMSPLSATSPPSRPLSNQVRVLPLPNVSAVAANNMPPQKYDDIIKGIIGDLVHNTIPLSEQASKDNNGLAMRLSEFGRVENDNKSQESGLSGIPFFLREKIILQIQKSKTCAELANTQGSIELYSNLLTLGEMSIRTSIAFLVERFFSNMLSISMEYISKKSMSDENMANLCLKLFSPAVRTNLSNLPIHEVQIKTLWLLAGAIVKDFGFDPCLYPLSEAIHHLIMTQYPLTNQNNNGASEMSEESKPIINPIPTTSSQRTTLLSALPLKPEHANRDINKKVIIKYRDNEQVFTFHQLSNGTPTVMEIMENSKSLFNIVNSDLGLGLFYEGNLVTDDLLNKLFNDFSTNEIRLEIMQTTQPVPKLTEPLQSIGSIVPSIPIPKRPHSVKALDDIIGRISQSSSTRNDVVSPPPQSASAPITSTNNQPQQNESSNTNGVTSFVNKTLPQPVYQPIL